MDKSSQELTMTTRLLLLLSGVIPYVIYVHRCFLHQHLLSFLQDCFFRLNSVVFFFCWNIFSVSEWGNHSGPPTFSWALRAKKSNFWNGHHRGAISFIRGSMWSPEIPTPWEHVFWVKIYCPKKQRFWSLSVLRSNWRGAQFRLLPVLPICMSNPTDPFVSGGFRHLKNIQKPLARWPNIAILLSSSIYKH